jgi:hypothetical protein
LSQSARVTLAVSADYAFAFGVPDVTKAPRGKNTGAVYSKATADWSVVAAPPFELPLSMPTVTAIQDRFLVAGVSCGESEADGGALPDCHPGTVALAFYDPAKDVWNEIAPPAATPTNPVVELVGELDGGAILRLEQALHIHRGDSWDLLPAVGLGMMSICPTDGKLVAAAFDLDATEAGLAPLTAIYYSPDSNSWEPFPAPDGAGDPGVIYGIHCTPEGIFAVPGHADPDGAQPSLLYLDYSAQRWHPVGTPPRDLGTAFAVVATDQKLAIWSSTARAQLDLNTGKWEIRPPDSEVIEAVALNGDSVILVETSGDPGNRTVSIKVEEW